MKRTRDLPTKEYLESVFDYDPVAGTLKWRQRTKQDFTDNAGNFNASGYHAHFRTVGHDAGVSYPGKPSKQFCHNTRTYQVNRVCWKIATGRDPDGHCSIYVKDGNIENLKFENLVEIPFGLARIGEDRKKRHHASDNEVVIQNKFSDLWTARIGKWSLGYFEKKEQALEAICRASTV